MKIVIAPDSFKGSLSAKQAAEAMAEGVRRLFPAAEIICVPMADGGEGTVETLLDATGGKRFHSTVAGPLGAPVSAAWGMLGDGTTAILEMAAASGLTLLRPAAYNPLLTSTYGTGELIRQALDAGATRILIGIGGSATNDGGAGMAEALGVRFLDRDGIPLPRGGAALAGLAAIDLSRLDPRLQQTRIVAACDVSNPLLGAQGASAVYGPQKGATAEMVELLDRALAHLAGLLKEQTGVDVAMVPGAGAAGGLGAGLIAFTGARLERGVRMVIEAVGLEKILAGADLVLTGEGKMDRQTVQGKTPQGVAAAARSQGIPVLAVAGTLGEGYEEVYGHGIAAVSSIFPGAISLAEALHSAPQLVAGATERLLRAWRAGME